MPASRNFGLLVIKKQAAAGTAETTGTGGYGLPVTDGGVSPQKEYGDLPRAGATLTRLGRFAQRAQVGGTVTAYCSPDAAGLAIYNVMGTELATAVAGTKTKHTFVMADTWPSPLTVWSSLGSGSDRDVWRFRDAQVSRMAIHGTSGEVVMLEMDFIAKDYTKLSAGLPSGYALSTATPRYKYIGSQVRLDSNSAVPTLMSNVESVNFEVNRDPEVRFGPSLTPSTFAPDRLVNFSANAYYDTGSGGTGLTAFDKQGWKFLEDAYLAALDGAPDQSTPTGSFDVTFGRHPIDTDDPGLRIVSGGGAALPGTVAVQQNWNYETTRPSASGQPTLLEYDLNGVAAMPAAGTTEATVILVNDVAAIY